MATGSRSSASSRTDDGRGAAAFDEALAVRAAEAYYLHDASKVAIAEDLGITRFQVARLLQQARRAGLVTITVRSPDGRDGVLGSRVADALGLQTVHVLQGAVQRHDLGAFGSVLATALQDAVDEDDVVGLTWSQALVAMSQELAALPRCTAVQLAGHAPSPTDMPDSAEVVRRASRASGGTAHPLMAPMFLTDAAAASSILRQPQIASTMEMFGRLDVAVVSVGAWLPHESSLFDAASQRDRDSATRRGVVGEISGRLFDTEGREVHDVIGDRIVGIFLEQLAATPVVIGASFGVVRAEATLAAVRGGFVDQLVIDRPLAEALLLQA